MAAEGAPDDADIAAGDQVTYTEAAHITGLAVAELRRIADEGALSRGDGDRLQRGEVEALSLQLWRRTSPRTADSYWCTPAEAAQLLRVVRQHVYALIQSGRLPASRTGVRDLLIRRAVVERLLVERTASSNLLPGVELVPPAEAAKRLRVTRQTIYHRVRRGQMSAISLANGRLFVDAEHRG